jgi:hypothetical protein
MLLAPELVEADPERQLGNLARPRLHLDAEELAGVDLVMRVLICPPCTSLSRRNTSASTRSSACMVT